MYLQSCTLYFIPDHSDYVFYFVVAEQIRNFSRSQQVVDQDQELLIRDLSIRHEEHRAQIFEAGFLVQVGKIELQVGTAVSFS